MASIDRYAVPNPHTPIISIPTIYIQIARHICTTVDQQKNEINYICHVFVITYIILS